METYMTFTDDGGKQYTFYGNTLLVFIDETGHELLQDKNYPIFGLGGCLCYVRDYQRQIYQPWKAVENFFNENELPLHASALKKSDMGDAQFTAINNFFTTNTFGRFASVVSQRTINSTDYDYLGIAISNLYQRVRSIIQGWLFDDIVLLIEASERTKHQVTHYFGSYKLLANGIEKPMHHFFLHKKDNEPGIIVADFIIHSAGVTVFAKGKNKIKEYSQRRDFENIFLPTDKRLASFIEINSITPGPS